jgi:hypothetical protein
VTVTDYKHNDGLGCTLAFIWRYRVCDQLQPIDIDTQNETKPARRPTKGMSCAAPLERENGRAESGFQNAPDLEAALRRQLHAQAVRLLFALAETELEDAVC